jgi:hypothetical protein
LDAFRGKCTENVGNVSKEVSNEARRTKLDRFMWFIKEIKRKSEESQQTDTPMSCEEAAIYLDRVIKNQNQSLNAYRESEIKKRK